MVKPGFFFLGGGGKTVLKAGWNLWNTWIAPSKQMSYYSLNPFTPKGSPFDE